MSVSTWYGKSRFHVSIRSCQAARSAESCRSGSVRVGVGDRREGGLGLPRDPDVGAAVLGDLGRVDVDVDDLRARGPFVHHRRQDPLVEPDADGEDEIRLLEGPGRGGDAVHARHPDPPGVGRGETAEAHQRRRDGQLGEMAQASQLAVGAADDHAAACIHHWPFGLGDRLRRRGDLAGMAGGGWGLVAGDLRDAAGPRLHVLRPHVDAHVDEHRAGPSGLGDVDRLGERLGQLLRLLDEVAVLDDRESDPDDVGLLERVGADAVRPDLPGEGDHRNRIHIGVGDGGDEVRRPGPRCRGAHRGPAGDLGVALGGVAGTLLVAREVRTDRRVIVERVEQWDHRPPGDPEHGVDSGALQSFQCGVNGAHARVLSSPAILSWPSVLSESNKTFPRSHRGEHPTHTKPSVVLGGERDARRKRIAELLRPGE